ncbi:hypothetical protein IPH92_00920 [Candidatus Kaiserbacteria bacterium]|nr:MAG: hypothetical protein IPH92_00920 [Candidatus Kaiserbacteria bacterium]
MSVQDMPRVILAVVKAGEANVSLTIPTILLPSINAEEKIEVELETIRNSSEVSALANVLMAWYDGDSHSIIITIPVNPFAEQDTLNRMLLLQHLGKRVAERSFPLDLSNLREIQQKILE